MMIPFHVDKINEILRYLDEIPHKFSRNLIDFFKNHVEDHIQATEQSVKTDIQETSAKVDNTVAEVKQTVDNTITQVENKI